MKTIKRNSFKYVTSMLATAAMSTGLLLAGAGIATANTGDFHFEVTGYSTGEASAEATIKNSKLLKVNGGATQVLWQNPEGTTKLSKKSFGKAWKTRIKVNATGANSSKVIFKKSKRQGVVVLKPGSKIRNTGMHNQRRVGNVFTVKRPLVAQYDKKSKQYRHKADVLTKAEYKALQAKAKEMKTKPYKLLFTFTVGGKTYYIVEWCENYIGGKVPMIKKVTWVRFKEDLQYEGDASAEAEANVSVNFRISCPATGAYFDATGNALAKGSASSLIKYSERTLASMTGALKLKAKQNIKFNQDVATEAQSTITVKGNCGTTPPPPVTYDAPAASGSADACVAQGEQNGKVKASGVNPNAVAAPGTLTIAGQTKQFASVGAGQSVTWDFSGFAPGTYNGSFTLGAPINKSATFSVTVLECEYKPSSIVEVTEINDVLYGNTRTWRIRGVVPAGQSAVLKVSARIGTVKESDKSINLNSGAFDLTITYTAPTEGSSDTLTAKLFGSNGVKDDEASTTFELRPNPVDPL